MSVALTNKNHKPTVCLIWWCMALSLLISGCAAPGPKITPSAATTDNASTNLNAFDQWVGDYVSTEPSGWHLKVEALSHMAAPSRRGLLLTQTHRDPSISTRAFELTVAQTDNGLISSFSPVSENSVARACPLSWQWSKTDAATPLLFGRSATETCQFQTDGQLLGLIKEMSFDGQTLRFADQLIEIGSGERYLPAQITRFEKVELFAATVARQEGEQWRVAEANNLPSDGQRRAMVDAAGMAMDIALSIEPRMLYDQIHWVLVISDANTADVIGQAWRPRGDGETLGWASADMQVEIRRLR